MSDPAAAAWTDEQVAADPWAALVYTADQLTPGQFATAVAADPWAALYHVADRLTDDQFDTAAAARPAAALAYGSGRLTDAQRAWCRAALDDEAETAGPFPASPDTRRRITAAATHPRTGAGTGRTADPPRR